MFLAMVIAFAKERGWDSFLKAFEVHSGIPPERRKQKWKSTWQMIIYYSNQISPVELKKVYAFTPTKIFSLMTPSVELHNKFVTYFITDCNCWLAHWAISFVSGLGLLCIPWSTISLTNGIAKSCWTNVLSITGTMLDSKSLRTLEG